MGFDQVSMSNIFSHGLFMKKVYGSLYVDDSVMISVLLVLLREIDKSLTYTFDD
jgi:hypothetical protein